MLNNLSDIYNPGILDGKSLLIIPSRGMPDSKVLIGDESTMRYEQRQEGIGLGPQGNFFVTRSHLPQAEDSYRRQLFGSERPKILVPNGVEPGVPLDVSVLNDQTLMRDLANQLNQKFSLYGFSQTPTMRRIAEECDIQFYGNPDFARWAGTKTGLNDFVKHCGLRSPHTVALEKSSDIHGAARILRKAGYTEAVVKVTHSIGGRGHKLNDLSHIISETCQFEDFFPPEYCENEGAVLQGWIPNARSMSIAIFLDFDDSFVITGTQAHKIKSGQHNGFQAVGAEPVEDSLADPLLKLGRKLAEGYRYFKAYGPHTMGILLPPPEESIKLGFQPGEFLCIDENSRPGATTLSRAWIRAITDGACDTGWAVSKVHVANNAQLDDVFSLLRKEGLLIERRGTDAHGIFVMNGGLLEYGRERIFTAIAISKNNSHPEANEMLERVHRLFSAP